MVLPGAWGNPGLLVDVVEHVNYVPYYPSSLLNGFAYIIGLQGMNDSQVMNLHGYVSALKTSFNYLLTSLDTISSYAKAQGYKCSLYLS